MADFWGNFMEALGLGKANHIGHASEVTDQQRREWQNKYVDNLNRYYEENTPNHPKIENAKQNGGDPFFTREDDDFVGEYNSDNDSYETRVYSFDYLAPSNGKGIDTDSARDYRTGKVLVRVPKDKVGRTGWFGSVSPWFDDSKFQGSNIGVYEAVLDDGTVLDANQFKDLVQSNQYGWASVGEKGTRTMPTFRLRAQDFVNEKDKLKAYRNYRDNLKPSQYQTKWDKNWRRFVSNIPLDSNNKEYTFYFNPGPNGE